MALTFRPNFRTCCTLNIHPLYSTYYFVISALILNHWWTVVCTLTVTWVFILKLWYCTQFGTFSRRHILQNNTLIRELWQIGKVSKVLHLNSPMARKHAAMRPALVSHNSLVRAKPANAVRPLEKNKRKGIWLDDAHYLYCSVEFVQVRIPWLLGSGHMTWKKLKACSNI